MSKGINLGKKLSDMISVEPMTQEKEHYPDLYISEVDDKRIAEMPDSGEATIKYRVLSRTYRQEKNRKDSCSLRLEIPAIDPPTAKGKKKESDNGARKAMSDYFKDKDK